jgi:maltooligosyltrehalose trehalohydrolase
VNTFLQKIGASYDPASSEFIVWSPQGTNIELILSAGGEDKKVFPMEKNQAGYWKVLAPASPGDRYSFRVDGKTICPDPASLSQPEGVHGPSELLDRGSFPWSDGSWKGIPLGDMIIYELHTGTFSASHDFKGIVERLDYLQQLGVNAIELMPLGQFAGDRNWGYDGAYPFAVQNSYGGAQGFRKLVNAAHGKGIAILVDVVYNHIGPEGNYLNAYAPYFTDKYKTPWGMALNFDDAWSDGVRNYFLQNARMWLEEYHVDGLRLDAVHAIRDFSAVHFMQQLKEMATEVQQRMGCKKLLIAEIDLNDTRYIDAPGKGGYGLDGQWIDEFHHSLRSLMTGEKKAYYEDFGDLSHLEKAFRHTYVYDGNYSVHRKRTFGGSAGNNPYSQFVVFAQNHDQVGNRAIGDRLTDNLSFEQLKLAAATVLLSPYTPLLFMGEEYGETNPFLFFSSFGEPALIEAVSKGRNAEFPDFASDTLPDPQSRETFQRSQLSWKYREGPGAVLYRFYQCLIALRKARPAMQDKSRDHLNVYPSGKGTLLSFDRKGSDDQLCIWLHFGKQPVTVENDRGDWLEKIFDSSDVRWLVSGSPSARKEGVAFPGPSREPAPGPSREVAIPYASRNIAPGGPISLSPFSAVVFEKKYK